MIDNVNEFFGTVANSELARAARQSARTIWNAHRAAFDTTRQEAGRMLVLAIDEGQKLNSRGRKTIESVLSRRANAYSGKAKPRAPRKSARRAKRRAA
ncbi:MAG: phasin family protein [Steroidobacteraceae bacterium]